MSDSHRLSPVARIVAFGRNVDLRSVSGLDVTASSPRARAHGWEDPLLDSKVALPAVFRRDVTALFYYFGGSTVYFPHTYSAWWGRKLTRKRRGGGPNHAEISWERFWF